MPPYTCHGAAKVAEVAPATPFCLHEEDTTDHKCFEACADATFKTKGITMSGRCPAKYSTIDSHVSQLQCPDGVTNVRYCKGHEVNVTVTTKGMSGGALALALAQTAAPFTWDSCGFRTDRLLTKKVAVSSSYKAGSSMTVTASGVTNLHVPLETGAWQVRIYETGEAKSTSTAVGDLMKALKFDDAKNTTFTVKVSFPLPKKLASGKFSANLVAVDQAKADYMCLDLKYSYAAAPTLAMVAPFADRSTSPGCKSGDLQCAKSSGEGSYCKYWLDKAVCQGSNKPCQCSCRGDDFCRSAVRPDSYCKYWQIGAGKVCQYSN